MHAWGSGDHRSKEHVELPRLTVTKPLTELEVVPCGESGQGLNMGQGTQSWIVPDGL